MANVIKPAGVNIIWANAGTRADPGEAKANIGWVVETPPYQHENWLEWKQDSFIAHFNQHGMPVWDAVTEYQGNLSYVKGSDGVIYKCKKTNSNIDPTNALNSDSWVKAFEDFGTVAIVANDLLTLKNNYTTLAGIGNTAAARVNLGVWSKSEADVRYAALLGNAANTFAVAPATLPEHAVRLGQVSALLVQATESTLGVVQLATNAKTAAGTDDLTAVTPLKAATVYLSKAGNLQGLANAATARLNLGLGSASVQAASFFLSASSNLADVPDKVAARANLGLTSTAGQAETYFLRAAQNLADVVNKVTARANLGLTDTAITPLANLMQKAENLAGLTNTTTARNNLGLADSATLGSGTWLRTANNLADIPNKQAARNNLALGSAATMNALGTTGTLDFTTSWENGVGWARQPNGMVESYIQTGILVGGQTIAVNFPFNYTTIVDIQVTGIQVAGYGNVGELMMQSLSYTNSSVTLYVRRLAGSGGTGNTDDTMRGFIRVLGYV